MCTPAFTNPHKHWSPSIMPPTTPIHLETNTTQHQHRVYPDHERITPCITPRNNAMLLILATSFYSRPQPPIWCALSTRGTWSGWGYITLTGPLQKSSVSPGMCCWSVNGAVRDCSPTALLGGYNPQIGCVLSSPASFGQVHRGWTTVGGGRKAL